MKKGIIKMKKNKAFILGSYHCCYSFTAEQMPKSGETVMGYRFKMSGGAKGHGQMLACALAGTETSGIMSATIPTATIASTISSGQILTAPM